MMWNNGMSAGGWILMSVLVLLFWAVLVAAIALVVRANRGPRAIADPGSNARRILDERLASGDITEDDYRDRRRLIGSDPSVAS